jgi:hypothetical protein
MNKLNICKVLFALGVGGITVARYGGFKGVFLYAICMILLILFIDGYVRLIWGDLQKNPSGQGSGPEEQYVE